MLIKCVFMELFNEPKIVFLCGYGVVDDVMCYQ